VASALQLGAGEQTQHSLRVRYLDEAPFSLLSTYVPEYIGVTYSESDLVSTPLLELLERSGVGAAKAHQTISATLASPDAADALGVEIGSPLLSLTRVVLSADGHGIEYLSALYRPDRHAFRMEMVRTGRGAERRWQPTVATPTTTVTSAKPKAASRSLRQKPAADRHTPRGRRRA
jgi:GntR family transcriptional regulator